jgi:hypothetical protein
VVYAKRPFGGPDAVLAYLSRYTHRTAIANSRLFAFDGKRVAFKWKDYRAKGDARYKHWPVGSSAYPTQLRRAARAMAPKAGTQTKNETLARVAAGA